MLETAEPIERDVQDRLGEWYLLRILPYRTKDKVEGVVVTLIAISRLKATEKELRRLSKVFMDGADPIIIEDLRRQDHDFNAEAERAYRLVANELIGKDITFLDLPTTRGRQARELRAAARLATGVPAECRNGRTAPSAASDCPCCSPSRS